MVQPRRPSVMDSDDANIAYRPIKITAVGDGMVGKTCMLLSYTDKQFPEEYVPTVFDNRADNITVDNQNYSITIWDTAGQEDYERLRPLSYPNTQCFLLCFAVNSRASYENIYSKWTPEIRHHCPDIPIVLVGTKIDLREESNMDHLTINDGNKMRKKIKAAAYVECSAKDMINLDTIFITAVRSAVGKSHVKAKPHVCLIL